MSANPVTPRSDAQLWFTAIVASLVLNVALVLGLGLLVLHSLIFTAPPQELVSKAPEDDTIITIVPVFQAPEAAETPEPTRFVRTSPEQAAERPEAPDFIGERDTRAASETEPIVGGPELPSQSGVEPKVDEVETTRSDYQDGNLAHDRDGVVAESGDPGLLARATQGEAGREQAPEEGLKAREPGSPTPPDVLLEGPLTVDRPVPMEHVEEAPKPMPEARERSAPPGNDLPQEATNPPDRGFRGNQRKTELKGSISRRGESALDVEDSKLGRYHAAIGRAIEKAWQRKVVENRDFITPGVLRIRVVLDAEGKVRSVGTVDEFGVSAIQRGFTHSAIREAELPAMPDDVKRELDGEALELLYNFIF